MARFGWRSSQHRDNGDAENADAGHGDAPAPRDRAAMGAALVRDIHQPTGEEIAPRDIGQDVASNERQREKQPPAREVAQKSGAPGSVE